MRSHPSLQLCPTHLSWGPETTPGHMAGVGKTATTRFTFTRREVAGEG